MKSLHLSSCYAVAAAALVGLAACAGESTSPSEFKSPTSARFALGDVTDATPVVGKVKICKSAGSNVSGVFAVSRTPFGPNSSGTVSATPTVAPGQCIVVAEDVSGSGSASDVIVDETSAGFVSASAVGTDGPVAVYTDGSTSLRINSFHGFTVTYVNFVEPPHVDVCTYTKGWYRNNGSNTIIALADGLSKSQQQQVFNATPGKPGLVTWTGGNNTLNLYQQLLAAINNLGGDETAGPAAVDAAIAAAKAGTNVTTNGGGVQIGLVAGTDVSGLIATLSSFNEGSLVGFPHCGDEVIAR
jgi:hypothetical protein